jgi:hypothetical protein
MVSQNWKNTNKTSGSFPRAFRDSPISGGAPTPKKGGRDSRRVGNAFLGFLLLVGIHTVLLWLAVRVAESAGIVTWNVGWWDSLKLATLYVVWKAVALMAWNRH